MHPYVHCSIIYNSQDMEATQLPINRQMGKEDVVYIYILHVYVYIYIHTQWDITHKKEWNFDNYDDMDGGYYTKWNKSDKDKSVWFHLHLRSEKLNKGTNRTETDS